jgi:hypothetical protein
MRRRTEELIFNLQADIALRRDEKNRLLKIVAIENYDWEAKAAAQQRIAEIDRDNGDTLRESERLKAEE